MIESFFFWCRGEGAVDELRNERKLAVDDKKKRAI